MKEKIKKCRWCKESLYSKKHVRHEKKWLHGVDAIKGTWYGAYGFCCEGCWAQFVNSKLKIKEVKL